MFRLVSLPTVLSTDHNKLVLALFDWLVTPCLALVRKKLKELVSTSDSNLTMSLMYLFQMLLSEAVADEKTARENKNLKIWIVVRLCECVCCTVHGGLCFAELFPVLPRVVCGCHVRHQRTREV